MALSRRRFLHHTLAVGPVALVVGIEVDPAKASQCGLPDESADCTLPNPPEAQRYIPNEPKVITRYSASEMAQPQRAAQLQQFREGICLLRDLPPNDVLSWTKQVAQHCIHCASSNTSNIHYDWQFLPWHRAFLYFLERAMRKLSGHDDLRLTYWDWENPASRTLPAIYAPPDQPLFWQRRNLSGPRWPLSDSAVNVQPLLGLPDFRIFGGTPLQRTPTPAAYSGPHANVHNAFSPGDMANLQYSPRDPVFYAHHGNIDRLWTSWVAAGHSNPDFGDARVYFYDEKRVWRYVLLNDLRDESRLGYRYSSLMKSQVAIAELRTMRSEKTGNRLQIASAALEEVQEAGPDFLVIENIQNLDELPADTVDFGIFSGSPAVGTKSATAAGFLGTVSRVLSEGHHHPAPLSAAIEVTDRLGARAAEQSGALELTVAPLDAEGKTTAPAIPLQADAISVIS